jgi:RNA polymerase subunit RPABC4/transcription elongation factor Spt4
MALIKCKDCGTEISDAAAACPKCGAPVPRTIGPDKEQCPWCMTVVSKDATICPGCRAVKGYATNNYGVMGKWSMMIFGVGLTAIIAIVALPYVWEVSVFFAAITAFSVYRLWRGPVWYQSKHV